MAESLAARVIDVKKCVLNVRQLSALLRHGIEHLQKIEQELDRWLEEHEYHSVRQLQGTMSQAACPTPSEFERVQYMKAIQTYRPHPVKSR